MSVFSAGRVMLGLSVAVLLTACSPQVQVKQPSNTTAPQDQAGDVAEIAAEGPTNMVQPAIGDGYQEYSAQAFAAAEGRRRVYFFHAKWCPTCKVANEDFENNSASLPDDVVVFKTDYDSEDELKQRYGITYQHTFVQVDDNGNEVAKWNGGGVNELIAQLK